MGGFSLTLFWASIVVVWIVCGTFNNTNLTLFTSQYKLIVYLYFTSHRTIAYMQFMPWSIIGVANIRKQHLVTLIYVTNCKGWQRLLHTDFSALSCSIITLLATNINNKILIKYQWKCCVILCFNDLLWS